MHVFLVLLESICEVSDKTCWWSPCR